MLSWPFTHYKITHARRDTGMTQSKQSKLFVCWFAANKLKKKGNDECERMDYDVHTARIMLPLKTWNYLLVSWFSNNLLLHILKHLSIDILILTIGYYLRPLCARRCQCSALLCRRQQGEERRVCSHWLQLVPGSLICLRLSQIFSLLDIKQTLATHWQAVPELLDQVS